MAHGCSLLGVDRDPGWLVVRGRPRLSESRSGGNRSGMVLRTLTDEEKQKLGRAPVMVSQSQGE
jgi:hypothetical protein